ncbi:rod shape-determining protein RodA [Altericroceibacterium spongiae]|uniref:Peptidoglycan glycosyltransferase MrdB n=1 Tax=Altericroceibacterium spongiae TaxID=2320269 RepID=A0A420ERT6_9SPHN|nr:rod shape-determining protein RodA [Altericroceibacterium spongiae]RKF23424.1 rod shape-determining protein RodA [Altericroceibacterium spongiae]
MRSSLLPGPIAAQPWRVIIPLTLLTFFGATVLYSAAGGSFEPFASSQLLRYGIFLLLALVMSYMPQELVRWAAFPVYGVVVLLLIGVETIGAIGGGSQRWLNIGPLVLQPSELMKPAIVLALAQFYHSLPPGLTGSWRALIPAGVLIAVPMGLVLMQPDLGTSLAIAFGGAVVMFLAGLPMKWFVGGGIAGLIAVPLAFFFGLEEYQQRRVTTFLDPESDPLGAGYHITQSKIAIGSGGLFGKGFGNGSQSHLNYLPEPHTDFVFATMAEEWGLLGGLAVLLIFGLVLRWGLTVARRAPDRFSGLLAGGMTATIFFYVAINLMMVMGLAPVVGIPLPWMSHGGSSMMTNMICIGTIMMVDRWNKSRRSSSLQ